MSDHEDELASMRHLMDWISRQPDLLPEAPPDASLASASERAREDHLCLKCGARAEGFFWVRPSEWTWGTGRWMDLCPACCALVYEIAASEPMF